MDGSARDRRSPPGLPLSSGVGLLGVPFSGSAFCAGPFCGVLLCSLLSSCGEDSPPRPVDPGTASVPAAAPVAEPAWVPPAPIATPNVLLVTVDTLRADHLGCFGGAPDVAPHLDTWAASAVRFPRAQAAAPLTAPSHASLLTGLHPRTHGVQDNALFRLSDEVPTLAEHLRAGGYTTAAFVSAFVLDSQFGLDQGFTTYDDQLAPTGADAVTVQERGAEAVTDSCLAWLAKTPSGPRFVWLHYYDPHYPYEPLPEWRAAFVGRPYDAEIRRVDTQLQRVFEALGAAAPSNWTVILTADHGESLGEHQEETHGNLVFQSTAHVPLVWSSPELEAGEVLRTVSVTDVAPTLLETVFGTLPPGLDGRSFRDALLSPPARVDPSAGTTTPLHLSYRESELPRIAFGFRPVAGLSDGRLDYLETPRPALYDLAEDPGQLRDLAASRPDDVRRFQEALAEIRARPRYAAGLGPAQDVRSQMQNLGYAVGAAGAAAGRDDWTVQELAEAVILRNAMRELLARNDLAGCLRLAEKLLAIAPDACEALELAGTALARAERYEEAAERLGKALDLEPNLREARWNLATCLYHLGDENAALDQVGELLTRHPEHVSARLMLAERAMALGELDEAQEHVAVALRASRGTPEEARARALDQELRTRRGSANEGTKDRRES